ncbi:MAG: glycosyltransferase family 39 protein [Candidatus Eisenbacteria bacterium]
MKGRRKARPRGGTAAADRWAPLRRGLPWVAVALYLALGAYRFDPKPSVSGDNAQFLILGESLATGRGLSHINEPVPSPNTKYPFLFPLILAGVHVIAPGSVPAAKVAVFLLGAVSIFLLARIFLRLGPFPVAAAATVLTAIHPVLLEFSHQVLSEVPYLLVSALALTFFLDWEDRRGTAFLAAAAAAALGAYFTRSIGIALVGSVLLVLLHRRRIRFALVISAVFLVAGGSWGFRNRAVGGGESYVRQFLMKNPYRVEEGALTFRSFVRERVGGNLSKYGGFEAGRGLVPAPFTGILPSEAGWRA